MEKLKNGNNKLEQVSDNVSYKELVTLLKLMTSLITALIIESSTFLGRSRSVYKPIWSYYETIGEY